MITQTNGGRYLYNLGYHTYEESWYVQLTHSQKLSKQAFDQLDKTDWERDRDEQLNMISDALMAKE